MRRVETLTVEFDGRDKGKSFNINEMPAYQAEEWFTRAVMLLAKSGLEVPPDIMDRGAMAFVAMAAGLAIGGLSKCNFEEVRPLLQQMMECVEYVNPAAPDMPIKGYLMLQQIEEPRTILWLREKIISLHLNFSLGGYVSIFLEEAAMKLTGNGQNTETSQEPLE